MAKLMLNTIEKIEKAFKEGNTVYWRTDKNYVIKTSNTLKLKIYVNKEKYIVRFLDRILATYSNDFYILQPEENT